MAEKDPVLIRLEAACARREYCESDIFNKALKLCEGNGQRAAEIVSGLKDNAFVSDKRYACAFAREKAKLNGWGPHKIRMALSLKKIDRDIVELAIEEAQGTEADEKLEKLLQTKWRSLKDDPQAKLKLLRFALGRGYSYEQVKNIVENCAKKDSCPE